MLIQSVGALADIVSDNLSRDHTVQDLHVGREDFSCVEGPHIFHCEAVALDSDHGRGDSLLHSQADLEIGRRVSLVALVAGLVGQMSLGHLAEVRLDLLMTHAVARVCTVCSCCLYHMKK